MSEARKIAVCTPIHRYTEADFTASLLKTIRAVGKNIGWLHVVGQANIAHARNILVSEALKIGATDIVFVDADLGWEPEAFAALFQVPDDVLIVGGAPQRRADGATTFCSLVDPAGQRETHGRLVSGHLATAFMRIRARVFGELGYPQDYFHAEGACKSWFFHDIAEGPSGQRKGFVSSDFYFSQKCREEGYGVWIDPQIKLRHYHSVPLTAVMADFISAPQSAQ